MLGEWRTHVWLHNLNPSDCLVLDAGCFTGLFGAYARDYGHFKGEIVGVDLDESAIKKAAHILSHVVYADVSYLPFKGESFDLGVSTEVLEHLTKVGGLQFLKELKRTSRRVVISTPNGFTRGDMGCFDEHPLMIHQYGWSIKELREAGAKKIRGVSFKYGNTLFRHAMTTLSWVYPCFAEYLIATF